MKRSSDEENPEPKRLTPSIRFISSSSSATPSIQVPATQDSSIEPAQMTRQEDEPTQSSFRQLVDHVHHLIDIGREL